MKVTSGLLWFLCIVTLVGMPIETFFLVYRAEGDDLQQMGPGLFVMNLLVLLLAPRAIRNTARSAKQLGEGTSWLAWSSDRPFRSVLKAMALGCIGLSIALCASDTIQNPHNGLLNGLSAAHLAVVAFWLFALRSATVSREVEA